MENRLTVKTVPFMGADLMAVKDEKSGKIYAGVRWMCDGIGLTRGQMNNESIKIREDAVLSQGARNLVLPTKGGKQEVQCIDREFIPMWLAKISITPAMQAEHPEVTDRLVQYQLKAAKVLADAFLHIKVPKSDRHAALASINHAAELLSRRFDKAGIEPNYTALAIAQIYRSQGIDIPELPVTTDAPTYDFTAMAKILGVMSQASGGKSPHAHAVGAIVTELHVPESLIIRAPFTNNGHSADYDRYKASVLNQVKTWLEEHNYPSVISGALKSYRVVYKEARAA